nr:hypothetical protein [Saprospiraceae bacterium]
MKLLLNVFTALCLMTFFACQSDQREGEETETDTAEEVEVSGFDPANPPFETDRDPEVVYVDNEYVDIVNGVGKYSAQIAGRTFIYHQFDIHEETILDIHVSSLHDKTLLTFLNPERQQLVRQTFGGPDNDFSWNERFQPGKYTISVSLVHENAREGEWTDYELTIRKVN